MSIEVRIVLYSSFQLYRCYTKYAAARKRGGNDGGLYQYITETSTGKNVFKAAYVNFKINQRKNTRNLNKSSTVKKCNGNVIIGENFVLDLLKNGNRR